MLTLGIAEGQIGLSSCICQLLAALSLMLVLVCSSLQNCDSNTAVVALNGVLFLLDILDNFVVPSCVEIHIFLFHN